MIEEVGGRFVFVKVLCQTKVPVIVSICNCFDHVWWLLSKGLALFHKFPVLYLKRLKLELFCEYTIFWKLILSCIKFICMYVLDQNWYLN